MKTFTKEELEELLMWSSHLAGCNPLLLKKIQSMIDDYNSCKHVWIFDKAIVCIKCGVVKDE
jgi:hypothetical protein